MSDFFSGLFGGGGGDGGGYAPTGGGGGGDALAGMYGGGDGGGFDLSSLMGGDSGGGLGSLFGGMGMGGFDPSQPAPPAQQAQGGDPGGQLAASQGTQGQQGQQGQGQDKGFKNPIGDVFKMLMGALKGGTPETGYTPPGGAPAGGGTPLSNLAGQALPPQPGYGDDQGQQPTMDPNAPIPPSRPPGIGPNQSPAALAKGGEAGGVPPTGPNQSPAAQAKGGEAGGLAPDSPQLVQDAPIPPSRPTDTIPAKLGADGTPPGGIRPDDPRFGQNRPGAQGGQPGGQQGIQEFMRSPLGMLVGSLLQQALGRMGPAGQMIGQMLSPMLSQLAGQAGFGGQPGGPGQSRWNPEYPANLRGREMWNQAIPGGAAGRTGNRFTDQLVHIESNGQNIVSKVDKDDRGLTLAQGGNPNQISQGYFQIRPSTWRIYAARAGVDPNILPRQASFEDQRKVAQQIPIGQWGPNTKNLLRAQFGNFDPRMKFGQVEAMMGGGGSPAQPANYYRPNQSDARRRARERLAMGWQY